MDVLQRHEALLIRMNQQVALIDATLIRADAVVKQLRTDSADAVQELEQRRVDLERRAREFVEVHVQDLEARAATYVKNMERESSQAIQQQRDALAKLRGEAALAIQKVHDDAQVNRAQIQADMATRDNALQAIQQRVTDLQENCCKDKYDLEWHDGPPQLVALEGTTKVIVQTPDEFLASFSVSDFNNPATLAWMQGMEVAANRIGAPSAFGRLFSVPGKNYVLKIVNNCPNPMPAQPPALIASLCALARAGDAIFRLPNTADKKMVVWAPNYLVEGIIGILLSRMKKYTPGFMRVYGMQYNPVPPEKPLYVLAESLTMLGDHIHNTTSYLYAMFQAAQAINTAQMLARYTHHDLHANNIMARPLGRRRTRIYELGDGRYMYTRFDFDMVVIDYGLNRMETKDSMLVGRAKFQYGGYPDILDFGAFNPYIDLFELIHFTATNLNDSMPNFAAADKKVAGESALTLLLDMVGEPQNVIGQTVSQHLMSLGSPWRPAPERLAMQYSIGGRVVFSHCRTPQQFMVALARSIETRIPAHPAQLNAQTIHQYLNANYFMVLDRLIKPNASGKVYTLPSPKSRMETRYLDYRVTPQFNGSAFNVGTLDPNAVAALGGIRTEYEPFNVTRATYPDGTQIPAKQIWIHVAEINVAQGKEFGYKFNFECCRIDLRTYMQASSKNGCVAINAAFFRILDDYTPIGYFKSPDYISNTPFPANYIPFYSLVYIDEDGNLGIDHNLNNHTKYDSVLSVGPLLVRGGQLVMTDQVIRDNALLRSVAGQPISPGELAHAANPNPRSALGITNDGRVLIVHVEGRGQQGAGVDCAQLAQICSRLGAVDAVNLDGGRSSQLTWRAPGSNVVSVSNHTNAYPVGNIISFCK